MKGKTLGRCDLVRRSTRQREKHMGTQLSVEQLAVRKAQIENSKVADGSPDISNDSEEGMG